MKSISIGSKIILFHLLFFVTTSSQAVVITSGCAGATTCSLAELFSGGSITINDVVFDNWVFNFEDGDSIDSSSVMISGVDETATATPGEANIGLNVIFNPELLVEFIEYDFDFNASIVGSSRLFTGSRLELIDSSISGDGFVEINNALSNGNLLSVDDGGTGIDSASFAGLSSLIADTDIQMETFDNSPVGLSQFYYGFTVFTEATSVAEPGTFGLLLIYVLSLGYRRFRLDIA